MQLKLRYAEAVYQTNDCANHQNDQDYQCNRRRRRHVREYLKGRCQQRCRDTCCQTNDTAGGNISTSQYDTARDTKRDRKLCRRQRNDIHNRRQLDESRNLDGDIDNRTQDDDEHRVIQEKISYFF